MQICVEILFRLKFAYLIEFLPFYGTFALKKPAFNQQRLIFLPLMCSKCTQYTYNNTSSSLIPLAVRGIGTRTIGSTEGFSENMNKKRDLEMRPLYMRGDFKIYGKTDYRFNQIFYTKLDLSK